MFCREMDSDNQRPLLFPAGLVFLLVDQLPLAASGFPTESDRQLLNSLLVSCFYKYLCAAYCPCSATDFDYTKKDCIYNYAADCYQMKTNRIYMKVACIYNHSLRCCFQVDCRSAEQ